MADQHRRNDPSDDRPGQLRTILPSVSAPDTLHDRVKASLLARNVLRRQYWPRTRFVRTLAAAACAAVLFGAGVRVGRGQPSPSSSGQTREYVILLYGNTEGSGPRRVEEHRAWALRLRQSGHTVAGRKLGATLALRPSEQTGGTGENANPGDLTGYFVITATTDAAAIAIARSIPHVVGGGTVVVRAVDRT